MNAYKHDQRTPEFGAVIVPPMRPLGWRMDIGLAARDLSPFNGTIRPWNSPAFIVSIQDSSSKDRGGFADTMNTGHPEHADFAPWLGTAGLIFESPGERLSLLGEIALGDRYDPFGFDTPPDGITAGSTRIYLPRIGLRYRPLSWTTLRCERIWSRIWTLGATLDAHRWLPFRCEGDLQASYGPYLDYRIPYRSGWAMAWSLRTGF